MNVSYSIKDLAQITRIKPHTLRIWEQRYGIMRPERTETNIRQYNQSDLKYLLNVSLLYDNGFKISKIAKLTEAELNEQVKKVSDHCLSFPSQIQNLVVAMLELDEDRFDKQISSFVFSYGLEETMKSLIFPFLGQVGILWITNTINPSQEHFITNLIRQKLYVAIDGICQKPKPGHKTILLFLPEGELHEIGLLFCNYLVKSKGHKVIYLGQSLPLTDISSAKNQQNTDLAISIITSCPSQEDVNPYLQKLKKVMGETPVWLSGYQVTAQQIECPNGFIIMQNLDSMISLLEGLV